MSEQDIKSMNIMDIKKILELLPHRYPFIMVDRILDYEVGKTITGIKNVSMNEPFFQGHFPGEPVMPGVLLLEGMAQAGGILAFLGVPEKQKKKLVLFAGIDKARFRRTVVPGDQVVFKLEMVKMSGKAYVEDQVAAEADLMATFA